MIETVFTFKIMKNLQTVKGIDCEKLICLGSIYNFAKINYMEHSFRQPLQKKVRIKGL